MKLANKNVLISGGSSGIGLAAAELFQAEGGRVAITGRSPQHLAQAGAILGDKALICASDSGSTAEIEALIKTIAKEFGQLDILILNAGSVTPAPFHAISEASFDTMVAINFKGVFFTLQKALPLLRAGSSVIITTSIANQLAVPNFSVYAACKAALRSLVTCLAIELIPQKIRVNALSPGPIATPLFERFGLSTENVASICAEINSKSPMQRFGTAAEVAKAMLFLASDDAAYIVGEEIVIDGGISLV